MKGYPQFFSLILVFSIGIVLSYAVPASPRSILAACYVAPGGDDAKTCTDPGNACATINGALDKAGCTDVIFVAAGTYTGTGDEAVVTINKNVELNGGWDETFSSRTGMSTIDGGVARRGVFVESGTAFFDQFIITNGQGDGGAGIYNNGNLTLYKCSVENNIDIGDETSEGGGIRSSGTLIIRNSTVMDNQSSSGAGVFNAGGILEVTNSTISGNMARGTGGGINNLGGEVHLNNATINNNTDNTISGEPVASGIHNEADGDVELKNSIVAGNTGFDLNGQFTSAGYNLIGSFSDGSLTSMPGDLSDVDPGLGALQDNGGPTETHALLFGSLAINAGNPIGCQDHTDSPLNADQRFFPRIQRCDIGAFEFQTFLYQTQLPIVIKSNP
jgi:hypothetical protein